MAFELFPKQREANRLLAGPASHILLRGGSRSGKTFLICRAIAARAARAGGSRHGLFRQRFNHMKTSIIADTWPKMMKLCYPELAPRVALNRTDWFATFPNGSEVWFGGLDEGDRTEKVLGMEFSTIFLNEASQISYASRNKLVTRLAQNVPGLRLREYTDCNPPNMGHWLYLMYGKKQEPKGRLPLADPENYASMQINPINNPHLAPEYIKLLQAMPESDRKRFLDGEFLPMVEGALWTYNGLDSCRVRPADLPPMRRIVVAVDPSGCAGPEDTRSDEIGIVVVGEGEDKRGYLLDDRSGRYSPEGWAREVIRLYRQHKADRIVAERNFGGALVEANIRAVDDKAPVKLVTASRGKQVRAEPVAALYTQGKVSHLVLDTVDLSVLEEQMCNFSTAGYQGMTSPDRADALVWGLSELMLDGGYVYDMAKAL